MNTLQVNKFIRKYSALAVLPMIFGLTAVAYASGPAVTIAPSATNLKAGSVIKVSASGFSANEPGAILECNSDKNQPTQTIPGTSFTVPVSCTNPTAAPNPITFDGSGNLQNEPISITIKTGQVGPPQPNLTTDNSGGNAVADAKKYPCEPTGKQLAVGDYCEIRVGDFKQVVKNTPIFFTLTAPTHLSVRATSKTAVKVSWTASSGGITLNTSTNKVALLTYSVNHSGRITKISPSYNLSTVTLNVSGLKAKARYSFYVTAQDYKGHVSPRSSNITVTMP